MGDDTLRAAKPVRLWETLRALASARAVLLTIAVLSAAFTTRLAIWQALAPPDTTGAWRSDVDLVMLKQGLDATPRFRDTGRWWTGQWIGCNPFWRPLSSYAFWAMCKGFGWGNNGALWTVLAVCHLLGAVLMFLLVEAVTGRSAVACLAVALFNLGLRIAGCDLVEGSGLGYLSAWVYSPDAWLALCALPALWTAWLGKLWWAVLLAAMAAGFKETGFVVFPLAAVFYWYRHRRWHHALWALAMVAALMAAVHLVCVGPGWVMGSNRWMLWRMFLFLAGEPLTSFAIRQAPAATLGIALALTVLGWRARWLRYGSIPAGIAIASLAAWRLAQDIDPSTPYVVSLCWVLDWRSVGHTAIGVAAWVVAAYAGMRGPDRALIVLFVVAYYALGFPATIAPQTGVRSFFTAFMMSSAAEALCVWAVAMAVAAAIGWRVGIGETAGADREVGAVRAAGE